MSKFSEAVNAEIDFAKLTPVTADELQFTSAKGSGPMGISIVNTSRNGSRVKFTKGLFEALGSPKNLQFATKGDSLYVGPKIPHCTQSVSFSAGSGFNIIYNSYPAL